MEKPEPSEQDFSQKGNLGTSIPEPTENKPEMIANQVLINLPENNLKVSEPELSELRNQKLPFDYPE